MCYPESELKGDRMQIRTRAGHTFMGLLAAALLSGACSRQRHPIAAELEELTGCHTRVVWCQDWDKATDLYADRPKFKLMGFDSRDNRGEHWILKEVGSYARPMLTAKGTHIVYSDRQAGKVCVVAWGGRRRRELIEGFAFDTLLDPETGVEWVYYGSNPVLNPPRQDVKAYDAVMRIPLDKSKPPELVWNKTMLMQLSEHNLQVSSDAKYASLITPVGLGVASLPNGEFQVIGAGCWPSIAPGPEFLFWHFNGGHRSLAVYERDGANRRDMPINDAPGINGMEVFHPRWSNHPRFMGMDGPLAISGGGAEVEVYVGRFNVDHTAVEKWVQVTRNTNADFFVDVWVESGMSLPMPSSDAAPQTAAQTARAWPGSIEGLAFVWVDKSPESGMLKPRVNATFSQTVQPRALAHYGPCSRMELTGGSCVAVPPDDGLGDIFRGNRGFTIQAVVTAATQTPSTASVIMALTGDNDTSKLTLEQEGNAIWLRHDANEVVVANVVAGQPLRLALAAAEGQVTVYENGKPTRTETTGDINLSGTAGVVFGAAADGAADWQGSLEGVSIYGRKLSASEISESDSLLAGLMKERPEIREFSLKARLVERSEIPAPKAIGAYRRSLAVNVYDVLDPLDSGIEDKRLNVAQWVIMDRRITAASDRKIGEVYELTLAEFDLHKQLKSERISRDAEDFEASLYYDIKSAWQ